MRKYVYILSSLLFIFYCNAGYAKYDEAFYKWHKIFWGPFNDHAPYPRDCYLDNFSPYVKAPFRTFYNFKFNLYEDKNFKKKVGIVYSDFRNAKKPQAYVDYKGKRVCKFTSKVSDHHPYLINTHKDNLPFDCSVLRLKDRWWSMDDVGKDYLKIDQLDGSSVYISKKELIKRDEDWDDTGEKIFYGKFVCPQRDNALVDKGPFRKNKEERFQKQLQAFQHDAETLSIEQFFNKHELVYVRFFNMTGFKRREHLGKSLFQEVNVPKTYVAGFQGDSRNKAWLNHREFKYKLERWVKKIIAEYSFDSFTRIAGIDYDLQYPNIFSIVSKDWINEKMFYPEGSSIKMRITVNSSRSQLLINVAVIACNGPPSDLEDSEWSKYRCDGVKDQPWY